MTNAPLRLHPSQEDAEKFKPKLITWTHCEDFDMSACFEAFFTGVNGHEKGSAIWNEALNESK